MKELVKKIIPKRVFDMIKTYIHKPIFIKQYKKEKQDLPFGFNIIGNINELNGLGQSRRNIFNLIKNNNINLTVNQFKYRINLFHISPTQMYNLILKKGGSILKEHYNIFFLLWELEEIPKDYINMFNLFDEIWVPSNYIKENVEKVTNKKVVSIPYVISEINVENIDRSYFSLPEDKFLYLVMYDSKSTIERKNPLSAIKAYQQAFKNNNKTGLVIKVNNKTKKDLKIIKKEIKDIKNVYIISSVLTREETNSLIKLCDVFISLHRAEGFGLVLAEAMMLNTLNIATNYSSNKEFMNDDNSLLVDYKLVKIKHNTDVYRKNSYWAEPSINHAKCLIRKIYKDKKLYERIIYKAKKSIEKNLSYEKISNILNERVKEIQKEEIWNKE